MGWRTIAGALDAGTAVCAAFNAAYFLDRVFAGVELSPARRVAAAALAVVSLGALLEAVALLAWAAHSERSGLPASATWTLVRGLPFAGAAVISALLVRRTVSR